MPPHQRPTSSAPADAPFGFEVPRMHLPAQPFARPGAEPDTPDQRLSAEILHGTEGGGSEQYFPRRFEPSFGSPESRGYDPATEQIVPPRLRDLRNVDHG